VYVRERERLRERERERERERKNVFENNGKANNKVIICIIYSHQKDLNDLTIM